MPGVERCRDLRQVDRRLGSPGPRQLLQALDPVVRRRAVAVGRRPQAPALPRDGRPYRWRQRRAGAEQLAHHRGGHDLRSHAPRQAAPYHLPADRGELRLQIRYPRFTRVVLDYPADRFRFETNPAHARCRLPRLDGVVRRRRCRQCRQLLYRRDLTVQQHGGLADRGGPRRNRGTRATPRETTAAVRAPGQDGDVGGLSLTSV